MSAVASPGRKRGSYKELAMRNGIRWAVVAAAALSAGCLQDQYWLMKIIVGYFLN